MFVSEIRAKHFHKDNVVESLIFVGESIYLFNSIFEKPRIQNLVRNQAPLTAYFVDVFHHSRQKVRYSLKLSFHRCLLRPQISRSVTQRCVFRTTENIFKQSKN